MKVLIIAEHDNKNLKQINFNVLTAALALGSEVHILVAGFECQQVVEEAKLFLPVQKILLLDKSDFANQLAENMAPLIKDIAASYDYVVAGATTFGKNLLPRTAAILDVAVIADVIKIIDADTFTRPIYAGNALATVKSKDALKILTIRGTAFAATKNSSKADPKVEKIETDYANPLSKFEKQELTVSSRPELTSARIIVAGGRGLKSAENFHLLEKLADRLGAALGASRAAVDAGFAPNDYQVGQTGKVVAPDLYIAIGISGAIQHIAGMKESKIIVAINSDPDAPIFDIADYGLVGDLFKLLPELQTALDNQ